MNLGRHTLTLVLLVLAIACAPLTAQFGGIYTLLQTLLSLFQGPMLALLVYGAFSARPTPTGGLITLLVGTTTAGTLLAFGVNMLFVAFYTFLLALLLLWLTSLFTTAKTAEELKDLVYGRR